MDEMTFNSTSFEYYNDNNGYIKDYTEYLNMLINCYIEYLSFKNRVGVSDEDVRDFRNSMTKDLKILVDNIKSKAINSLKKGINIAAEHVRKTYKLDDLNFLCLLISLEVKRTPKLFEKLKLIDNKVESSITYETVIKLYYFVDSIYSVDNYYNVLKKLKRNMIDLCFAADSMEIDNRLFSYILSNGQDEIKLAGVSKYLPVKPCKLVARETFSQKVADFICQNKSDKTIYIHIYGSKGTGKRTVVKRISDILKEGVIFFDVKTCLKKSETEFASNVLTAYREALLINGFICIVNFDNLVSNIDENRLYINFLLNKAKVFSSKVIILSEDAVGYNELSEDKSWVDVELEDINKEESILLWKYYMEGISSLTDVTYTDMSNKFSFNPMQIKGTVKEAERLFLWNNKKKLSKKEMSECAYKQVVQKLDDKATLIHAKHDWEQLILDVNEKTMLRNACDQIKYKHIVYDKWGMGQRVLYGRGLSMLFAGPPGTGKTMAAQVIANELGLDIYKVDLSQIVSKYIGETEKNLGSLFSEAKKSNVILLFDETDALFGKRTEVKDSHDKNANVETSYLLQKMEEYDGITIMTTNYIENIDKAFFRRISYVIHFNFPDANSRKQIWKNMYPKKMPLSKGIDFDYLARQFELSGGSIKNIALTSAFMAARDNKALEMKHIILAVKYELGKQGKTLIKDDFLEYSYLLD